MSYYFIPIYSILTATKHFAQVSCKGETQSEGRMDSTRKNICRLRYRHTIVFLLRDQIASPRSYWSLKSTLVLMIWSQGGNNTACLFLILFVETSDRDNCQNVPCDRAYNNSLNCKEYLLDNSTTVPMRLNTLRQILCRGLRVTHSQKGFVALFSYFFYLQYCERITFQEDGVS